MKKNLKTILVISALLTPWMQVQANAQDFNLAITLLPTRTLASSLTAPTGAANPGGTVSTSLGAYSVVLVSYTSPYTVSVAMSQLTSSPNLIPWASVTYVPGSMTWVIPATSAATSTNLAFASVDAVVPISVTKSDAATTSMSWVPSLSVVVPGSQAAGVYTATVTHSLS